MAAQRTIPKKTAATATPTKKKSVKRKKSVSIQSFRLSHETEKFISSRITRQTIYWLIISLAILTTGLLILKAQLDILEILHGISGGIS